MQYVVHKKRYRMFPIIAVAALALLVGVMGAGAVPGEEPSDFMEGGSTNGGDGNVRADPAVPGFDWANSGAATPDVACSSLSGYSAVAGFTTVHVSGDGGLFDCGQGNGQFTTPIAPVVTAAGTVGTNFIDAIAFQVDPLASDNDTCGVPQTQDGDPTVFTKTGGEKNGDSLVLNSTGANGVETWSTGSVPPKDEITNAYAVSRTGFTKSTPTPGSGPEREVFFGAERVVNDGDTHIDFEFLQAPTQLTNNAGTAASPPGTCAGKFDGHRTHGDFIVSIDYTRGGSLGTFALSQWHCNTDTHSADNSTGWVTNGNLSTGNPQSLTGTLCDRAGASAAQSCTNPPPTASDGAYLCGTGPHYQEVACVDFNGFGTNPDCSGGTAASPNSVCNPIPAAGCAPGVPTDAVKARTNGGGPVPCGGWACRLANGTTPTGPIGSCTVSCVDTNELMEGAVNLKAIGFTGCISTFIPHTRSSASFTATTKDFELIPFNTCTGAIKIVKQDNSSPTPNLLLGACFTVGSSSREVCDNQAAGTNVPGSNPARNTTVGDEDSDVGEICLDGLGSGNYTVTETVVPAGYVGPANPATATVPSPLTTNLECPNGPTGAAVVTFTNTLGSIQWEKRSDIDGSLQTGAEFTLSPNPFDCHQPAGTIESPILDNLGSDTDTGNGQYLIQNVCLNSDGSARTYTITETKEPPNFGKDPDATRTCQVSATSPNCAVGTKGEIDDCAPDPAPGTDADGGAVGTDTGSDFCNPVGSLKWEKRAKDASVTNTLVPLCPAPNPFSTRCPLLGGASFSMNKNPHTGVTGAFAVADCVTAGSCVAGGDVDPTPGVVCINQVVFSTFEIEETASPNATKYAKDSAKLTATVNSSSTCDGSPADAGDFINTPLSEIEVIFRSLAGGTPIAGAAVETACDGVNSDPADDGVVDDGCTVTKAQIVCSGAGGVESPDDGGVIPGDTIGEDGGADTTPTPTFDDYDEVFSGLVPGTYNCQVVIDP